MKQDACFVIPASTRAQLFNGGSRGSEGGDEKFLHSFAAWNSATMTAAATSTAATKTPDSSCRSIGSLSSTNTTPPSIEQASYGTSSFGHNLRTGNFSCGGSGENRSSNGGSSAASSPQLLGDIPVSLPTAPPTVGSTSSNPGGGAQTVFVHVNPGETLSVRVGNDIQHIPGPATVRMVSDHNSPPPMALPLHVPPGHIVQQIIDESGVLRHVILSPQSPPIVAAAAATPPFTASVSNGSMGAGVQFLPVQNGHHHDSMTSTGSTCQTPSSSFYPSLPLVTEPRHICQLHINEDDVAIYASGTSRSTRLNRLEKRRRDIYSDFRSTDDLEPSLGCGDSASVVQDDSRSAATSGTEDDELAKIAEMLSGVPPPKVGDVSSRQALVHWLPFDCSEASASGGPFPQIDASEFTYEVLVFERRREGVPRSTYRCQSNTTQQWLVDLRPSTEYFVKLRALLEERGLQGEPSTPVMFKTKPSQPDRPAAPRLWQRQKTALLLRWVPPCDNGSRITTFHLEMQPDVPVSEAPAAAAFHEVYAGPNKQAKVAHLTPSTVYRFRLAAANQFGKSEYSDVLIVQTAGAAPPAPDCPRLVKAAAHSLSVEWLKRDVDEEFRLMLEDPASGHGFLPVCVTAETSYTACGLDSFKDYNFRLCAVNEDGVSPPSDVVTFTTAAGEPQSPLKLVARTLSNTSGETRSVRLTWQPPHDTGGGQVLSYRVQYAPRGSGVDSDQAAQWYDVYTGAERQFTVASLPPGCCYAFRVACSSAGGESAFSDPVLAVTSCTVPGPCQPPMLSGKARQTTLSLKWAIPECTGGSDIIDYEVAQQTETVPFTSAAPCIIFRGPKTECAIGDLIAGEAYTYRVRARNKTGSGPWSAPMTTRTSPAPPDIPADLCCRCLSFNTVSIHWTKPSRVNGSPVTEYRLQQAMQKNVCLRIAKESIVTPASSPADDGCITAEYAADRTGYWPGPGSAAPAVETRSLPGAALVSTSSSSGASSTSWSGSATADVSLDACQRLQSSLELDQFGPFVQIYAGQQLSFEAKGLTAATDYAFRVQAVNNAGPSKFSCISIVRTPPGPPDAPNNLSAETLSCDKITVFWDPPCDNGSPLVGYNLDVQPPPVDTPLPIRLPAHCAQHLVENLRPETAYRFRAQAINEIGASAQSASVRCSTFSLPPPPPLLDLLSAAPTSLKLRWSEPSRSSVASATATIATTSASVATPTAPPSSELAFIVEMENRLGGFCRVYEGAARTCKVQRLHENSVYRFRIRALAVTAGQGAWSSLYAFKTAITPPPAVKDQIKVVTSNDGKSLAIEWQPVKMQLAAGERILYTTHLCSSPSRVGGASDEIKMVYKGAVAGCEVSGVPAGFSQYRLRITAVRCTPAIGIEDGVTETSGQPTTVSLASHALHTFGSESAEPYSSLSGECSINDRASNTSSKSNPVGWTDKQWAVLILLAFSAVTVFVAILLQQLVV